MPARPRGGRRAAESDEIQNSGCFPAEIRYRVVQHAKDNGPVFAREALFERRKPAAHRYERRTHRLGGNDALDVGGGCRIPARGQDFLHAMYGTGTGMRDVHVASWMWT